MTDKPMSDEMDKASLPEKLGTKIYRCLNQCDDYQNVRTNNPFANCGRCGSRLVILWHIPR